MRDGDVEAQHLGGLRIPNILKTELKGQIRENDRMVVKRLSMI